MNSGDKFWTTGYYKTPTGDVVPVSLHGIDLMDAVKRFPDQYSLTETFPSEAKQEVKKPVVQKA